MRGLGSSEAITEGGGLCCDVCSSSLKLKPPSVVDLLQPMKMTRKRTVNSRKLSDDLIKDLRERLLVERQVIVSEEPGYKMLGVDLVCPVSIIEEICDRATELKSIENLKSMHGVRPEFYSRFLRVVTDVSYQLPPEFN